MLRQSIATLFSYSDNPHEQEILLGAGYRFQVDKVEQDSANGKYLIYLTH